MAGLPSGTITFLYTDIEGSTHLWEQNPTGMKSALARHNAVLRAALETNDGQLIRTVGDGFCVAFRYPHQALKAAVDAQHSLYKETWETETPIRARMALHTGEAEA